MAFIVDVWIWPFALTLDAGGAPTKFLHKGQPVAADQRFIIGFITYDVQSGGQQLMRTRDILANPAAKRRTTTIDTRSALIDGILNRKEIS